MDKPNKISKKTLNETKFLDEWFKNGHNQTQAYIVAFEIDNYGTAATNASMLIKKSHIQIEIARRQSELAVKSNISREFIVEKLLNILKDSEIHKDRFNGIRAITELNKMAGFYKTEEGKIQLNMLTQSQGEVKISFGSFNPDVKSLESLENKDTESRFTEDKEDNEDEKP